MGHQGRMSRSSRVTWAVIKRARRWSAVQGDWVIGELERSGLDVPKFAIRHGLDQQRVYFWRKRVESPPVEVGLPMASSVTSHRSAEIEIELRCGHRIRVSERVDTGALRRIVSALEG